MTNMVDNLDNYILKIIVQAFKKNTDFLVNIQLYLVGIVVVVILVAVVVVVDVYFEQAKQYTNMMCVTIEVKGPSLCDTTTHSSSQSCDLHCSAVRGGIFIPH